jgi:hypothetical protein
LAERHSPSGLPEVPDPVISTLYVAEAELPLNEGDSLAYNQAASNVVRSLADILVRGSVISAPYYRRIDVGKQIVTPDEVIKGAPLLRLHVPAPSDEIAQYDYGKALYALPLWNPWGTGTYSFSRWMSLMELPLQELCAGTMMSAHAVRLTAVDAMIDGTGRGSLKEKTTGAVAQKISELSPLAIGALWTAMGMIDGEIPYIEAVIPAE